MFSIRLGIPEMEGLWVYGPGEGEITVIGLEPHPEDKKRSGYAKVRLSGIGQEDP